MRLAFVELSKWGFIRPHPEVAAARLNVEVFCLMDVIVEWRLDDGDAVFRRRWWKDVGHDELAAGRAKMN